MEYKVIQINTRRAESIDNAGELSFVEAGKDIPFAVRRLYWIYGAQQDTHRGFHAHTLNRQLLFCPYGSISIILDDGETKETILLDSPSEGLILTPGLWREIIWNASDSVLCVAASEYYDPDEYIRDYDEFLAYRKQLRDSNKEGRI